MKRLHVSVGVSDLEQSVRFYSTLFAAGPTVRKSDYAKWMLEDPRVNFAISTGCEAQGINHLGIQAESEEELDDVHERLSRADGEVLDQGHTTCCYARSTKQWINDPQGVTWETFLTHGQEPVYGHERNTKPGSKSSETVTEALESATETGSGAPSASCC